MDPGFLEEWLQRVSSPSSSSPSSSSSTATAREIAHSWIQLRECLQKGELQGGHLTCLQKLQQCGRSLHVADAQAKLLLSLLSSDDISADPDTMGRARGLASLILSTWVRKSPSSNSLLDTGVEISCKSMGSEQKRRFFVCEGILLVGSLSAAPNVSAQSRKLCMELVAELLHKEKQTLMSQGRIAEALAGAGYALFSSPHVSCFRSILLSLLSLWDAGDGTCPGIPHGLMVLHLMEWVGLKLLRPQTAERGMLCVGGKMNVVSVELLQSARRGKPALDFAAVMGAAGILRAYDRNRNAAELPVGNAPVRQLRSCMEETIFTVAENALPDFGPVTEGAENSNSDSEPLQFAEWIWGKESSIRPMRRLILQCVAVALSRCGEIRSHARVLLCLVVALLTETFPLRLMYSESMMGFSDVLASGGGEELVSHVGSLLFKEAGATTRVMCNQYRPAHRDSKQLVEDMMWEYSRALYQNHRLFAFMLISYGQRETRDRKSLDALDKITEAAFFMIVMFFSTATEDKIALANTCDVRERVSVRALDALSCVEFFRHVRIPEYSGVVQHAVSCVSKSASACAALIRLLPSYHDLTHWPGPSNLGYMEYDWSKDEVQTSWIFFYLRVLPTFVENIPDSVFGMKVAPVMFLYMQHPAENVARGSHSVFVAFTSTNNPGLDLSHVEGKDEATLKEQLAVYYIQRALEGYPGLTPFEGLASGVEALVRHLPAGSPAILYCINSLVEKTYRLYNVALTNQQEGKVEEGTESAKKLQVLLLHLILLVDIQVLPDLLRLLAQLIIGLPEDAQNTMLDETYNVVAGSDDVTRKPTLVPWFQSLSYICSQLNSGDIKNKQNSDRSSIAKQKGVHLNKSTDKSVCVSLNPTGQKCVMQLCRL